MTTEDTERTEGSKRQRPSVVSVLSVVELLAPRMRYAWMPRAIRYV